MQSHALKYWNGQTDVSVGYGISAGQPFVVNARSEHWIPVNVLVFAYDAEEAILIVRNALTCIKENSKSEYKHKPEYMDSILALPWSAEPYDNTLVSTIQWASNDTIG